MNQRYPTPARLSERVSAAQPVQREVARIARADMPPARFEESTRSTEHPW